MLRTLNNSLLAPDQDEAGSYRAVEFRVARRKLWQRERLLLPEKRTILAPNVDWEPEVPLCLR